MKGIQKGSEGQRSAKWSRFSYQLFRQRAMFGTAALTEGTLLQDGVDNPVIHCELSCLPFLPYPVLGSFAYLSTQERNGHNILPTPRLSLNFYLELIPEASLNLLRNYGNNLVFC